MISITKRYMFEAAHHLPNHKGKCARPHGHSYKVDVCVANDSRRRPVILEDHGQSDAGMVMDFADLDEVVKPLIESLDHHDLNERLGFRTTAEQIAEWFGLILTAHLGVSGVLVVSVTLWETEKAHATWTP